MARQAVKMVTELSVEDRPMPLLGEESQQDGAVALGPACRHIGVWIESTVSLSTGNA